MSDRQLAKMKMRCNRRGIKEMDVILGKFAQTELAKLAPSELSQLDEMLEQNDHDLLSWVLGREPIPEPYAGLIARIKAHNGL